MPDDGGVPVVFYRGKRPGVIAQAIGNGALYLVRRQSEQFNGGQVRCWDRARMFFRPGDGGSGVRAEEGKLELSERSRKKRDRCPNGGPVQSRERSHHSAVPEPAYQSVVLCGQVGTPCLGRP